MLKSNYMNDLYNNILSIAKRALDVYAKDVSQRMYWCYEDAIEKFYSSYEPHFYKRTGMLLAAASNWPFHKNPHKIKRFKRGNYLLIWHVMMEIGAENIPGEPYHADVDGKEWVLERSYLNSIHGYTKNENRYEWIHGLPHDANGNHINRHNKKSGWHKIENTAYKNLHLPQVVQKGLERLQSKYVDKEIGWDRAFNNIMIKEGFYK